MIPKISIVILESAPQNTHFEMVKKVLENHQHLRFFRSHEMSCSACAASTPCPRRRPMMGTHDGPRPSCGFNRELPNGGVESAVDLNLTPFRPVQSPESVSKCSLISSFNRRSCIGFGCSGGLYEASPSLVLGLGLPILQSYVTLIGNNSVT